MTASRNDSQNIICRERAKRSELLEELPRISSGGRKEGFPEEGVLFRRTWRAEGDRTEAPRGTISRLRQCAVEPLSVGLFLA